MNTEKVLNAIQNRKKPITRERLGAVTRIPDREVRESIQHLRDQGYPIMNDKSGKGYKIARTEAERDQIVADYEHRIKSMRKTVRALKRAEL